MDNPNQQAPYSEPPPQYSPPGYNQKGDSHAKASAPPPPVGLHIPSQQSQSHHHHTNQSTQGQPMIIYANTTQAVQFGPYPMRYTCPNCNAHVMTETHSTPGILTYVLSGALCFLAAYCCCCLIPFCVRECKDIEHRCPNCKHCLGLFKRI